MRARIKAQRPKNADAGGKLLSVALFDRESKKIVWTFDLPVEKASGEYEWYDVGEWIEEGKETSLVVNTSGGTFSIDCVEVQKMDDI
jgi:hypothetical protein